MIAFCVSNGEVLKAKQVYDDRAIEELNENTKTGGNITWVHADTFHFVYLGAFKDLRNKILHARRDSINYIVCYEDKLNICMHYFVYSEKTVVLAINRGHWKVIVKE